MRWLFVSERMPVAGCSTTHSRRWWPSLVSFRAIRNGSASLGFRPCRCPSPFPSPSISRCFSIHSSLLCHWISFMFFFTTDVSKPFTYSLFWWVSRLGTGSGTRRCGPRGRAGCAWSRNLVSNVFPGWSLNLGPCSLMAVNVTTRLRCTPLINI